MLGLEIKGKYKAYPFVELSKNGKEKFQDSFQNKKFTIHWDINSVISLKSGYRNPQVEVDLP